MLKQMATSNISIEEVKTVRSGRSSQLSGGVAGLPPLAPGNGATSTGSLSHRSVTKQTTALTTTGNLKL